MTVAQDGDERLVVIDAQRVFADPASPWATPGFDRAADRIAALLPHYAGRTVFTRFVAPEVPHGSWAPYYRQWPFALRGQDDPLWDVVERFDAGDAPVVTATTFGKWGDDLARAIGPDAPLLLAGVSTDCCVLSTALAAADAGRFVRVAADACAGLSEADHERALAAMALYAPMIELTDVDAVLAGAARPPAA